MKPPVRIAITGAAGQIGYAMLFRIAECDFLGEDQPVILHLLEGTESGSDWLRRWTGSWKTRYQQSGSPDR